MGKNVSTAKRLTLTQLVTTLTKERWYISVSTVHGVSLTGDRLQNSMTMEWEYIAAAYNLACQAEAKKGILSFFSSGAGDMAEPYQYRVARIVQMDGRMTIRFRVGGNRTDEVILFSHRFLMDQLWASERPEANQMGIALWLELLGMRRCGKRIGYVDRRALANHEGFHTMFSDGSTLIITGSTLTVSSREPFGDKRTLSAPINL